MNGFTPARARRWTLLGIFLLSASTLLAYWPVLRGGLLFFDDDSMLTNNVLVKAADGLQRMWFTTQAVDYWPVTNSSLWLEWRLWGANPAGYHVTNVLLHIAASLLLWAVLRRLALPGAWLAAMLFALHPVNVQSVAWIAQRKNTLSMVFFLLSVAAFLRHDDGASDAPAGPEAGRRGRPRAKSRAPALVAPAARGGVDRWYGLSFAAFVLAMLSKGSVAILPGVLLLLIWWRRDRITARDVAEMVPFVIVAGALTIVNMSLQARMPGGTRDVTALERLLGAGGVVWFYLSKALVPVKLTFIYPQWDVRPDELRWWAALAGVAAVTAVLVWQRRRPAARALLFAWTYFCLALFPVMGFTDVYFMKYSLVADHYQYLAIVGVLACVAAGLTRGLGRLEAGASLRHLVPGALWRAALLAVVGSLAWGQARVFADAETFYRTALSRNPAAWVLQNNLGALLLESIARPRGRRGGRVAPAGSSAPPAGLRAGAQQPLRCGRAPRPDGRGGDRVHDGAPQQPESCGRAPQPRTRARIAGPADRGARGPRIGADAGSGVHGHAR